MLKNNLKKKTIIIIGILSVIFVVYFIFFFGREATAPIVPMEDIKVIIPIETKEQPVLIEAAKQNLINAIFEPIVAVPSTITNTLVTTTLVTSSPIKKDPVKNNINISVPFTPQAPLANWKDGRQEDGCEEAVSLMAMAWVKGEKQAEKTSPAVWEKAIIGLSDFEREKYGEYRDVSLGDMIKWIFKDYFEYEKASIKLVASSTDILNELEKGNIVLAPMNGQKLKNPYFTAPGPLTHMILIKGYDYKTKEFIVNDPGTRRGENYRYLENVILEALNVYPTGSHEAIAELKKAVIIIKK